jgi:hypothetical protein
MNTVVPPDDEIDLLDLLVTISENIKLLVLGPLLAGLLALGVTWGLTPTYESGFVLNADRKWVVDGVKVDILTPAKVSQALQSPDTLKAAAQVLQSVGRADLAAAVSSGAVAVSVPRNTAQVQVALQAPVAADAQTMAQALLQAALAAPQGQIGTFSRLQDELAKDQAALTNARTMEKRLAALLQSDQEPSPSLITDYNNLLSTIIDLSARVDFTQARLDGLNEDDVVRSPSLPDQAVKPNQRLITVLAVLTTAFVLFMVVFVRKAFQGAAINPESAAKLARIRQALGWRVSKA